MANTFKYNASAETLALKKGNFWIGTNDVGKGPTSTTGFWHGISPVRGGYTVYLNKATNGPAIYAPNSDSELIILTNRMASQTYTTVAECLGWFMTQTDKMVLNRDYDEVITNGLVLTLDGGFTPSYPTANTTWYDISSGSNNVTLTNGPTYGSTGGGYLTFDGTNDYADFYAPNLGTTTTVEMLCKMGSAYDGKMFFGFLYYDVWCGNACLGYNTSFGDLYGISSASVSSLGLVGNWKHYVFEMRSDVSYSNNKIYINGVSQTLTQQFGSENSGARNFNSGQGRISSWFADLNYPMPMEVAFFRVYNRSLTQTEITKNLRSSGPKMFSSCKTCKDIIDTFPQLAGYDGLYWVYPNGANSSPYQVYCDMTTDGGGWMLVSRSHPTTVNPNGKKWGWKGGSIGNINDFSQAYQLGWGEIWDTTGSTFTSYIYGNQRTNFDNGWGPFIYKVAGITYSTFFNSDTQQYYTTSTIKSNTAVYGTSDYPGMQGALGYTTTGTNNDVYYMRDCCGFAGYGGYATQMTTTYCGAAFYYSGAWCGGSTNTGGIYDFGTYVSNGLTYGGTNQYMIMVK